MTAERHIKDSIIKQHASLGAFTAFLKLRFLLDPTSYAGDVKVRTAARPAVGQLRWPGGGATSEQARPATHTPLTAAPRRC